MLQMAKRPFSSLSSTTTRVESKCNRKTSLSVPRLGFYASIAGVKVPSESQSRPPVTSHSGSDPHWPEPSTPLAGCMSLCRLYRKPSIKTVSNALFMLKLGGVDLQWLNRSLKWEGCFPLCPLLPGWVGHQGAAGEGRQLWRSTTVPDTRKDSLQRGSDRDRTPLEKLPR